MIEMTVINKAEIRYLVTVRGGSAEERYPDGHMFVYLCSTLDQMHKLDDAFYSMSQDYGENYEVTMRRVKEPGVWLACVIDRWAGEKLKRYIDNGTDVINVNHYRKDWSTRK